jgi:hypothetical protein
VHTRVCFSSKPSSLLPRDQGVASKGLKRALLNLIWSQVEQIWSNLWCMVLLPPFDNPFYVCMLSNRCSKLKANVLLVRPGIP